MSPLVSVIVRTYGPAGRKTRTVGARLKGTRSDDDEHTARWSSFPPES